MFHIRELSHLLLITSSSVRERASQKKFLTVAKPLFNLSIIFYWYLEYRPSVCSEHKRGLKYNKT
jgi:hypothetical protein